MIAGQQDWAHSAGNEGNDTNPFIVCAVDYGVMIGVANIFPKSGVMPERCMADNEWGAWA